MSAKKIRVTAWECVCKLDGCPGKGRPWISLLPEIPNRCAWCKRYTWNRPDLRFRQTKDQAKDKNGKGVVEQKP